MPAHKNTPRAEARLLEHAAVSARQRMPCVFSALTAVSASLWTFRSRLQGNSQAVANAMAAAAPGPKQPRQRVVDKFGL